MTRRPDRMTPEKASALARHERRRIIVMLVGALLLAGSYFYAQSQKRAYEDAEFADAPAGTELPTEHLVVPEFDMLEVLEGVRDDTIESRLVVEAPALNAVFDYGRLFTAQYYEALGTQVLDADVLAALRADPGSHRVDAYRAHGEVVALRKRKRSESRPEELTGTLALEGGGHAHFVVLDAPADLAVGSFVRVNGVFLKLYRSEGADGWWDGPLICGAEAVASFPRIDLTAPIALDALAVTTDDTLELATGLPEDAKWELMARALADADGNPADPVDWDAVPLLDDQILTEIFGDGESYRGKPFRFDILRNLDGRTKAAGENPLRIDRETTGWIASQTWKGPAKAIHYLSPFDKPVLSTRYGEATYVTGRGFFFKNWSYETHNGSLGRVPVFVLASVDAFVPPEDLGTVRVMWGVLGVSIALGCLLVFLLMRDKKKSHALQAELVRRRRARRVQPG